MSLLNEIFPKLDLNNCEDYEYSKIIKFLNSKKEVDIRFQEIYEFDEEEETFEKYSEYVRESEERYYYTYMNFIKDLENITPDIIKNIIKYQNEHYEDNDYTKSFKYFENAKDVIDNVELLTISIRNETYGHIEKECIKMFPELKNDIQYLKVRVLVLIFYAEWVTDDYKLLSVALVNEKVVFVTEAYI